MMDSGRIQELLYDIIDKEASGLELEEFKRIVSEDSRLNAMYQFETRFRKTIGEKSSFENAPESLLSSVRTELDRIDLDPVSASNFTLSSTERLGANKRMLSSLTTTTKWRYSLAMAASIALVILGGATLIKFLHHQSAFGAFEAEYFVTRDAKSDLGDGITAEDASRFISEMFHVAVVDSIPGIQLCGGEVVMLDSKEFAHFKFCGASMTPISIFIGSAADYELPEMPSTILAGKEYFRHSCHGCDLLYWRSGDALIVAATSFEQMESQPISNLVAQISISEAVTLE
ncbi:MAG: hypothetical protein IIB00_05935 [candidate division Zixibacteria bacterium]|nr:hypothetical protein [candidate division Zixibacteria bacterium]